MKKTVIFLIFSDIKRDNFKYISQFLIKFGHIFVNGEKKSSNFVNQCNILMA